MKILLPTRQQWAWAMYDFANSAFATSVLSVIFSVYFARVLVPPEGLRLGSFLIPGESVWSYLISSVMLVVVFLSPLMGALADRHSLKRRFLILWSVLGAFCTMGLFTAAPGSLFQTIALAFLAILGFEMSLVFYNAFLKDISDDQTSGRVSGLGFAFGYIGGGLCLALNMIMINRPDLFGLSADDRTLPIRLGMAVVGGWWLVFSLPTFLWVKDAPSTFQAASVSSALRQLKQTLQSIARTPNTRRFLLAYLIYDDGIQTVLLMASIFGAKELGMSAGQLAACYLMIQFVAFVGALLCGRLADFWSHKKVVLTALGIYSGVVVWAFTMKSQKEFWILGVIVGLIMGGGQAASRSLFSLMVPKEKSTEYFALFSIVGKAAAFMGPLVFGIVTQFMGIRAGVASLLAFFIVGGIVLFPVQEKENNLES